MRRRVMMIALAAMLCCAMVAQPAAASASDLLTFQFVPGRAATTVHSTSGAFTDWVSADLVTSGGYYWMDRGGTASNPWVGNRYRSTYDLTAAVIPAGASVMVNMPAGTFRYMYTRNYDNGTYGDVYQTAGTAYIQVDLLGYDSDSNAFTYVARSERSLLDISDDIDIRFDSSDITADVYAIDIIITRSVASFPDYRPSSYSSQLRTNYAFVSYYPQSQIGLLSGILGILQTIWDTITSGFGNVVDAVLSIPQTIINLFTSAMQSLFVPTDEDLEGIFDDFDTLLEDKLGAIYQVGASLSDVWDALNTTTATTSLTFPAVSIPGTGFTLPAQTVPIWPAGFTALQSFVRTGTSMVIILLWIKGLHHRFSVILGSESDVEVST